MSLGQNPAKELQTARSCVVITAAKWYKQVQTNSPLEGHRLLGSEAVQFGTQITKLHDFRLPPRCKCELLSFGILRYVIPQRSACLRHRYFFHPEHGGGRFLRNTDGLPVCHTIMTPLATVRHQTHIQNFYSHKICSLKIICTYFHDLKAHPSLSNERNSRHYVCCLLVWQETANIIQTARSKLVFMCTTKRDGLK
jgi:hypothetical protein